ncbi:MAG TPA: four helix bundle protein [Pyrinomonadaceae bacterium]|nr:four helix bundle protein [Pyrinomonadaceae bacterium]
MKQNDLRVRTKVFALRIIKLYAALPQNVEAQIVGKQVLRSGTSVGAHYRESCRAKSNADFISKVEGGLQELEETLYWLELLSESKIFAEERIKPLREETEELIAMFVTMVKNVKNKEGRFK